MTVSQGMKKEEVENGGGIDEMFAECEKSGTVSGGRKVGVDL